MGHVTRVGGALSRQPTRAKAGDAGLQRLQLKREPHGFAQVLVIFTLAHKMLGGRKGGVGGWGGESLTGVHVDIFA